MEEGDQIRAVLRRIDKISITITFPCPETPDVVFVMKTNEMMGKVFKAHTSRLGKQLLELLFLFEGGCVKDHETPADYEMKNGDVIHVVFQQDGC